MQSGKQTPPSRTETRRRVRQFPHSEDSQDSALLVVAVPSSVQGEDRARRVRAIRAIHFIVHFEADQRVLGSK